MDKVFKMRIESNKKFHIFDTFKKIPDKESYGQHYYKFLSAVL